MKKLINRLRGIELPEHWLPTLLISGVVFGASQWVTRYTSGPTTILLRFLRFGLANFYATLAVDVSAVLLLLGWYTFAVRVALFVKKKLGAPTARSRAGRGAKKLLSKVLIVASYAACFFAPLYALLISPWIVAIFAVLVIQYPLHTLLRATHSAFSRIGKPSFKPTAIARGITKTISGIKNFFVWLWRYFFAASPGEHAEEEFYALPGTWDSYSEGKQRGPRTSHDIFAEYLARPEFFWREWSTDFDHLYPTLDEALLAARDNPSAKSTLEQEGPEFQLIAEIKHETLGYRLVALTVLPLTQELQPGIQYRVSDIQDLDAGV